MKTFIIISTLFFSLGIQADCYENLTDQYSNDSRHFALNIDEIESSDSKYLAVEAIKKVYADNNCSKPEFVEVSCRQLGKHSWSESCYVETQEGYFFVSPDMVQSVNIVFNRFD